MTDASKEENGTLSPDDNPDRTGPGSGEYDAADGQESEVSSAGMSLEEIRRQVQERVNQEASQAPPAEAPPEINSKFIGECLFSNELGDGTLYSALHRGRFVYVKNAQEWFEWAGHYWQQDIMQRSLAQVERVAAEYLEEYKRSAQEIIQLAAKPEDDEIKSRISKLQALQKALLARARALRGNKRRSACLNFSHTLPENPLAIKGNEFDMRPMLFPCGNGVIDLETGRLKPGRPEDFMSLASPVEFLGIDYPAPIWERSLDEIFPGNRDIVEYLQRLFGYACTGLTTSKVFPILYGKTGWNGRTVIVETISQIMVTMAGSIPSEMLLSSKNVKSSSAPSPDIMSIKGVRMAFASEIDENQRFSLSIIKKLTGGDELYGRHPHDKYSTRFLPTHKLFVQTNIKPGASANDRAFWERVNMIPFRISFVDRDPKEPWERRANLHLKEQLTEELPGILAWLMRGCLWWQRDGLKPPKAVLEETARYQRDEDLIADFVDARCIREPGAREQSSKLYNQFVDWYHEGHGKKEPSSTWFGKEMNQKFDRTKQNGCNVYHGIRLADDQGRLGD